MKQYVYKYVIMSVITQGGSYHSFQLFLVKQELIETETKLVLPDKRKQSQWPLSSSLKLPFHFHDVLIPGKCHQGQLKLIQMTVVLHVLTAVVYLIIPLD